VDDRKNAEELALAIRRTAIRMVHKARASHIGGCLSAADLLAHLYGWFLRVDPGNPGWPERDLFLLSKGHAAAGLYATLALTGFFPKAWLKTYCQNRTRLAGHVSHQGIPGVEVSTGSLGHGLPLGLGMALARQRTGHPGRVVVLMSDGECDEGSTWEAALLAPQLGLDNLLAIIDINKIQALGRTAEVADLEPLDEKWKSFRWGVRRIDGHDHEAIRGALGAVPFETRRPSVLLADTVKGKGVSFMENRLLWHYRSPNDEEFSRALTELEVGGAS
jgi:transketolase